MPRFALGLVLLSLLTPAARADVDVTAEHRDSPSTGSTTFGWFEDRRYGQVSKRRLAGGCTRSRSRPRRREATRPTASRSSSSTAKDSPSAGALRRQLRRVGLAGRRRLPRPSLRPRRTRSDRAGRALRVVGGDRKRQRRAAHQSPSGRGTLPASGDRRSRRRMADVHDAGLLLTAYVTNAVSSEASSWSEVKSAFGTRR